MVVKKLLTTPTGVPRPPQPIAGTADGLFVYMQGERGGANLLYVTMSEPLSDLDRQLLEIYIHNVALTFENINLMEDLHGAGARGIQSRNSNLKRNGCRSEQNHGVNRTNAQTGHEF